MPLLLSAIFGILLVVIPGGGQMLQLRMAARRQAARAQALPPQTVPLAPQQREQQTRPGPTGTPQA